MARSGGFFPSPTPPGEDISKHLSQDVYDYTRILGSNLSMVQDQTVRGPAALFLLACSRLNVPPRPRMVCPLRSSRAPLDADGRTRTPVSLAHPATALTRFRGTLDDDQDILPAALVTGVAEVRPFGAMEKNMASGFFRGNVVSSSQSVFDGTRNGRGKFRNRLGFKVRGAGEVLVRKGWWKIIQDRVRAQPFAPPPQNGPVSFLIIRAGKMLRHGGEPNQQLNSGRHRLFEFARCRFERR